MIESEFKWEQLPEAAERRLAVRVSPAAERALRGGHPWLYENGITSVNRDGAPGDLAVVFDRKRRFLAVGLYDPDSPIRVKILQAGAPAPIDATWFRTRLHAARALRAPLDGSGTTGYRLINGENDRFPGLVADWYDRVLVVKLYTRAWLPHLRVVVDELVRVVSAETVILRLSRRVQAQLRWPQDGMALVGHVPEAPVQFRESGLAFEADVVAGQKTGFFLDQRENRARARDLAAGKDVLDVFAAAGGFSVYAAAGGARSVTTVDVSQPALAAAERNMDLNRPNPAVAAARHTLLAGDAFQLLAQLAEQGRRYDLVILDPPSFAQRQADIDGALRAYARLTALGLGVLQSDGVLVQASCSSRVSAEAFFDTVHAAARRAGTPLHDLARTGHALDHPVTFPEGAYLKCLFATRK